MKKKSISKAEFYKNTGVSNGFLDKSDNISSSNLALILNFYEDLSSDWLITGRGDMLKSSSNISPSKPQISYPVTLPAQTDHSLELGCKLCKEKDARIADLKEMNAGYKQIIESQQSVIQSLQLHIDDLQQHHLDVDESTPSRTG